jgi:hypothetical protein
MANKVKGKPPKGGKNIKPPNIPVSTDSLVPTFCLEHLQSDYCLMRCEKDEKTAFADTLYKLSRSTWGQLLQRHKHKGGYEKIPQRAIRAAIPPIVSPDSNIYVFRFHELKPMVGIREGSLFRILWLDRDFTLYDHG